jgi:hypothetical protein
MKIAIVLAMALLVLLVGIPMVIGPERPAGPDRAVEGLPWQIEVLPEGRSRVFGLTLGVSSIGEVQRRFGDDGELAIVTAPGEAGALELYYKDVTLGAITGRLIATAELATDELSAMRARAEKVEYMQSSTKKAAVNTDDLPRALGAPLRALAFIPAANLDEAMVMQRFGQPAERIRGSEHTEHFLYPDKGLDLILDAKGKEVLQYVAPARFAELRQPLLATKPAQ